MRLKPVQLLGLSLAAASPALAQPLAVNWYSIDGGGTTAPLAGGPYTIVGTIGQPDAGSLAAGSFSCVGGFWAAATAGNACYANCDQSTLVPALNVNDFTCFLNAYAAGLPYANCDQSTIIPVLNVNDFTCFLNRY